jgi:dUTP pyrophosphatase
MKLKIIDLGYNKKPFRAHVNDAGADVYLLKRTILRANETQALPLGFGIEIPIGYLGAIYPRSGHAKRGLISQIAPIDSGYTGELHAIVTNTTTVNIILEEGERVGQLVIYPIAIVDFEITENKQRGNSAFNSTGK